MRTIILLSMALSVVACERRDDDTRRREVPGANVDREKQAEEQREEEAARPAADDTKKNMRDRDMDTLTPGDQGQSEGDIAITAAIRRSLVDDDDLTVTAQNVKIITKDGVVTLRGPVRSDAERSTIESYARRANGVKSVDNQLEVAPEK
jgi:osmotically-inducible protein OsmY